MFLLPSGLLGAHVMSDLLRQRGERMQWYRDELLHMAKELGHRLLPAFNTTSGLPYPKVFLILLLNITNFYCRWIICCKVPHSQVTTKTLMNQEHLSSQVNLRYGVLNPLSRTGMESDTCTACAGTMILEFAALSRLSGNSVFEVLPSFASRN